jgi:TonB-dependent receptor
MHNKITLFIRFFLLILMGISSNISAQTKATIEGNIKDAKTKEALWGANVIVMGTSLGASTDKNGNYTLLNVPIGSYELRVTYIGYKRQSITINLQPNRVLEANFEMETEVVEGEAVTVTAQRKGQIGAINQQLNSNTITNVVSSDKIQELPESNAAEAVGRLPGISLLREGGEGNKVVIRGLAPQFNKIQIDGVDLSATDPNNRSTDLSMISPYMLEGIEVSKAALANQEADQIGGTVNFITKGAPFAPPSYSLIAQGGYNGLREKYEDYKIVGQTSRRMFDDLLGISLNLDVEKRNRSSNSASAGYAYLPEDKLAEVNSFNVEDVSRVLNRYGGSLALDYKTSSTTIIMSNFLSRIDHDVTSRSENSVALHTAGTSREQRLNHTKTNTTILMDQIKWEQLFNNFKIQSRISYSFSKDRVPRALSFGGLDASPLARSVNPYATPGQVPSFMSNDTSKLLLGPMYDSNQLTREEQIGANLDLQWQYNLTDAVNIKFNVGGEYKHTDRKYDYNTLYLNISSDPSSIVTNALLSKYPDWSNYLIPPGKFLYEPFIDKSYYGREFMKGQYQLERVPDISLGEDVINYLENTLGIDYKGNPVPQKFNPNFSASRKDDYSGNEFYSAAYIMPIVSFGNEITFIPGVRYEHEVTKYNGVRGNERIKPTSVSYYNFDTTATRTNEFVLPMIHLKYKPADWFDVRLSYTQTLARPSYDEFLPKWDIYMGGIDYSNPNLKPAKSENYDLYFSFYGNKIGLFTIGFFAKRITNFVFPISEVILSDSMAINKYGLLPSLTKKDNSWSWAGSKIYSYINDPNTADIKGLEIEWQTNLWYLPGLLKNVVFDINYTYTHSKEIYPKTFPKMDTVVSPFGKIVKIVGNIDSSYSAPLLYQPDNILNITLGYDYEGFSIRASMQYQAQIFSQNDWYPVLRGFTKGFTLYDLTVSQKLPIEGLKIYGDLNNISQVIQEDNNVGTGYMTNKEYYGLSGSLGLRYEF